MKYKKTDTVRIEVVESLRNVQELLKNKDDNGNSDLVKQIVEIISKSYSVLLPVKLENKEEYVDERVCFLVEEMNSIIRQL